MKEQDYLIKGARKLDICETGEAELCKAKNVDKLINLYHYRIDYCLANDFPSNEYLLGFRNEMEESGVFIDREITLENREKIVLLGNSDCKLKLDKWTVCRAYVKHNSKLHIHASGNSIVMIDALDDAQVTVDESGDARVIVNLYASAKCLIGAGNPRITNKNQFTYDL